MLRRDAGSWNARAGHFYTTFERLLDYYGSESKGIVWAHNTHIGDASATAMGQAGMLNIGQQARDGLEAGNVVAIGFGTYTGKVLAGRRWEGPRQIMRIPNGREGTLENVFHRLEKSPVFVITRELQDAPVLTRPVAHRAIGVTYNPLDESGNYVPTIFPRRYDAFIFINETTPLTPLHEAE